MFSGIFRNLLETVGHLTSLHYLHIPRTHRRKATTTAQNPSARVVATEKISALPPTSTPNGISRSAGKQGAARRNRGCWPFDDRFSNTKKKFRQMSCSEKKKFLFCFVFLCSGTCFQKPARHPTPFIVLIPDTPSRNHRALLPLPPPALLWSVWETGTCSEKTGHAGRTTAGFQNAEKLFFFFFFFLDSSTTTTTRPPPTFF